MFCPNSAQLLEDNINAILEDIKAYENKLESVSNAENLMVLNHCVSFYEKDSEGNFQESRDVFNLKPVSFEVAKVLQKEINSIKDLPNVEIITYQEAIIEKISRLRTTLVQLQKY